MQFGENAERVTSMHSIEELYSCNYAAERAVAGCALERGRLVVEIAARLKTL